MASSDLGLSELILAAWLRWPHIPMSAAMKGTCSTATHGSGYPTELRAGCGISSERMFLLRSRSQNYNRKLRDLAAEIVTSHALAAQR